MPNERPSHEEAIALLEKAQEIGHIGSWVAELDGSDRFGWSAETHRIFGVPLEQFAGTSTAFFTFVHPDDRAAVRAASDSATANGTPILGKPAVVAAQTIKDVADSGRADPSLSTDQEDQGRLSFEAGKAAFMVNWPYVYSAGRTDAKLSATTKHVFENMGWAPYPSVYPNVPGRSSVGGANIGVSAYGPRPDLATQAALCMTRPYWQNQEAINEGLPPVTIDSYTNPQVIKAYPFASVLLNQLQHATTRPQTPLYSDVTLAIQQTLHPPGAINPTQNIASLGSCLKKLKAGGLC